MFEREIQFIYDFSHNKIKKLGSFITFSELKTTNLHPAILQYISAEIDFYIFEDRQKLLKDSLFDYSGNKINSYFMQISNEIKKSKRFSQSYIEKLILHSVTFTVNHLVSPNALLSQFIFAEETEKSSAEIRQILNYLYYYPHINKIISSYLDKKNLMKLTSEEFGELLKKIDKIGLEANLEKLYNEALGSMAEFFNIGMSGRELVPILAVQNYLKEKGLNIHLDKLQSEFVDAELTRYEIKDYQKVLIGVNTGGSRRAKEAKTEEVLESDLADNALDSHSFEPVVEEPLIEKKNSSVDIKIMDDKSRKVILDEKPIAEIDDESEAHIETALAEPRDEDSDEIIDGDQIFESSDPDEDLLEIPAKHNGVNLNDLPKIDSDIIEIEDERELENEAVAEMMELVKEEIKITDDEEIEGKEIITHEKNDESVELIDEFEKQFNNTDSDDAKKLYLEETGYKEDGEPSKDEKLKEVLIISEDEQNIEEIDEEEDLSIIDDEEEPVEFEEETIKGEKEKIPAVDAVDDDPEHDEELDKELDEQLSEEVEDENSMDKIVSAMRNNFAEELENEHLSESGTESVDTLSYLLNVDSVEMEEEDSEDEELNEADEKTESDEELELFKDGKEKGEVEEEGEMSLDGDEEKVVDEESSESAESYINITSLLENRKMSKIIDVIFDYDMEEFANTIEQIGEAPNIDSANSIIDKVCNASQISTTSKEAKLFKSIISDHYDRK